MGKAMAGGAPTKAIAGLVMVLIAQRVTEVAVGDRNLMVHLLLVIIMVAHLSNIPRRKLRNRRKPLLMRRRLLKRRRANIRTRQQLQLVLIRWPHLINSRLPIPQLALAESRKLYTKRFMKRQAALRQVKNIKLPIKLLIRLHMHTQQRTHQLLTKQHHHPLITANRLNIANLPAINQVVRQSIRLPNQRQHTRQHLLISRLIRQLILLKSRRPPITPLNQVQLALIRAPTKHQPIRRLVHTQLLNHHTLRIALLQLITLLQLVTPLRPITPLQLITQLRVHHHRVHAARTSSGMQPKDVAYLLEEASSLLGKIKTNH